MRRSAKRTRVGTWLIWAALAGILAVGCGGSRRQELPDATAEPVLIVSPQQDRTLSITVNTSRDDPALYLTLIFEVRDKATQAILHRQQTYASSRLAWSMRWLDNNVVQLQSSDIGTFCWQEQQEGSWLESECPFGTDGLTAGTVERLFEDGSAHVYRQDGSETIDLFCHVTEGTWCYFVPQGQIEPYDGRNDPLIEDEARRITSDVAEQLTKELGLETIAQSRNNGLKVRCARPEDARSPVACQVDRGGGWQESPVLP